MVYCSWIVETKHVFLTPATPFSLTPTPPLTHCSTDAGCIIKSKTVKSSNKIANLGIEREIDITLTTTADKVWEKIKISLVTTKGGF